MNFCCQHLGTMTIPKGAVSEGMRFFRERMPQSMGSVNIGRLFQATPSSTFESKTRQTEKICDLIEHRVQSIFQHPIKGYKEDPCFLVYKEVGKHNDEWDDILLEDGSYSSPAFLHVVLSGKFTMEIGRKKHQFKKGDVFAMNPNKDHAVKSDTLCMTYCMTVPMKFCKDRK